MAHTDIRKTRFIELFPQKLRPFLYLMRIDRPIGIWLLFLPGLWSIALAHIAANKSLSLESLLLMGLFALGSFLMRGAGCIINDIWDKDLDARVARTKDRPLASGTVSIRQALCLLGALLGLSLLILVQLNMPTIMLGCVAMVFVIAYPLMKRVTWWPQAFLGITFNFGAAMGWSAVTGSLGLEPFLLYLSCFFWTLGYDTIYAHQDIEDDALAGIKSTARLFGEKSKIWVSLFYVLSFAGLLICLALCLQNTVMVLLLAPLGLFLYAQISGWDLNNKLSALEHFKANKNYGIAVASALLIIAAFL